MESQKLTHVFSLKATGYDGMSGECPRTVDTTTCFSSRELANSRVESFRSKLLEREMFSEPITITVVAHEIIYPGKTEV
jgi:hypothetical protein